MTVTHLQAAHPWIESIVQLVGAFGHTPQRTPSGFQVQQGAACTELRFRPEPMRCADGAELVGVYELTTRFAAPFPRELSQPVFLSALNMMAALSAAVAPADAGQLVQEHPTLGAGLFVRLDLPLSFPPVRAPEIAARPNRAESEALDAPPFLGAWCCPPGTGDVTFVCFVPNLLYAPGLASNLAFWMGHRARMARLLLEPETLA